MTLTLTSCRRADTHVELNRRELAARLNETFRRHSGLTGYVHDRNRVEDEANMYDALEELGLFAPECADPDPDSRLGLITEWAERNPTNVNAIDMLWMAGLVRELSALTGELADDLEAHLNDHYLGPDIHPAMQAKYDRDMRVVRNARAALARAGR